MISGIAVDTIVAIGDAIIDINQNVDVIDTIITESIDSIINSVYISDSSARKEIRQKRTPLT